MKKVIIGCPYGGLKNLEEVLKERGRVCVINTNEITGITSHYLYIHNQEKQVPFQNISAAFVRYPYDLIPPHTETYQLREKTEFLKTIGLVLNSVSINKLEQAYSLRNRLYSLGLAETEGLLTPDTLIIKRGFNSEDSIFRSEIMTKALGNCYYSEYQPDQNKKYLSFEQDGDETAYIYPAHMISDKEDAIIHTDKFGACLIQRFIRSDYEFRIYVIGGDIFYYQRGPLKMSDKTNVDKSSCVYIKPEIKLPEKDKIINLAKSLNMNYLNLDAVLSSDGKRLMVFDINPYGSLPKYSEHPEATIRLAELIEDF